MLPSSRQAALNFLEGYIAIHEEGRVTQELQGRAQGLVLVRKEYGPNVDVFVSHRHVQR